MNTTTPTSLLLAPDIDQLRADFVQAVTEGIAYGIYVILGGISCYLLISQGLRTSISRTVLFAIIVTMFISSTTIVTAQILYYGTQIQVQFGQTVYGAFKTFPMALQVSLYIMTIFPRINYFLSDAVVIWRAFVLFNSESRLRFGLLVLLFLSLVATIVDMALMIDYGIDGNPPAFYSLILLLPLLFTNVVATMCIAYRTWVYQKINDSTSSPSGYQVKRVLCFLIESGFLYCIFWLLAILASQNGLVGSFTGKLVFGGLLPHLSAIYPTLMILMVSSQNLIYSPSETMLSRSVHFTEHMKSQCQEA